MTGTVHRVTKGEPPPLFLTSQPPHWVARGLAWVLLLSAVGAAVGAVVIRLPETVSSPFVLVPAGGTDPVRAPCDGVVAEIRTAEARAVGKSDALFVIHSDITADRSGELASLEVQLTGARESLSNAQRRYTTLELADREELSKLEARRDALARKAKATQEIHAAQVRAEQAGLAIAQEQLANLEREVDYRRKVQAATANVALQASKLIESHALSDLENMRIHLDADRARLDLQQSEREVAAARLKRDQLMTQAQAQSRERAIAADQLASDARDNQAAIAKLRRQREAAAEEEQELERSLRETIDRASIRIAALRKELERARGNEVTVAAPCAGSVLRLRVRGVGTFVRTGEVLCELAGAGERLQAELAVPQRGVGRVTAGQAVKLLYDAFPYQRYGVKYGRVRWVSPASAAGEEGTVFRALADLKDEAVRVEGEDRRLLAGMRGRAQILVGRRRVIAYLFEPLEQLRESLATEPGM